MDIVLQGEMDGIDAANHIRFHCNIPIVYLTAYADEKTLERAKITEPIGYILKPYEERELHAAIEMALYQYHNGRRRAERRFRELLEVGIHFTPVSGLTLAGPQQCNSLPVVVAGLPADP